MMGARLLRILKRGALLLAVSTITLLAIRAYDSQRGKPLEPWHTYVPQELNVKELDHAGWTEYLKAEDAIFESVRAEVTQELDPEDRIPINRYFDGSPVYPGHFLEDWNRSYILEPVGPPVGAAVFLHGLTDSPYSLRHIARRYREHGYVSIAMRLPAHGTVPGALTDVEWEDWLAATRLAVREARKRIGPSAPLHLVGFSNGGALAMMYALDALDNNELTRPDRIALISPMVGITSFARFAGLAGLPAIFPAFAKAAWLSVLPEFNPFKYNSFPINGARQSYLLTDALQRKIVRFARDGRLVDLPPIITFQSVMDSTVSTRAIVSALVRPSPRKRQRTRAVRLEPKHQVRRALAFRLRHPPSSPPARAATAIQDHDYHQCQPRQQRRGRTRHGGWRTTERTRELGLSYPMDVFSLSHVALPFPTSDSLYGLQPDPAENFGIHLGAIAARGERGTLIVNLDSLLRMSSNPFFPYLIGRIEEFLTPRGAPRPQTP